MDWRQQFCQPSRIDNFAQYLTGDLHNYQDADGFIPEYTDQMFVESLVIRKESESMKVGTALHKVFELANYEALPDEFMTDGYQIKTFVDADIELPKIREAWVSKEFKGITIRGKIDAGSATKVHDYKFTKQINLQTYMDSWQWRIYLWMTGKNKFIYDLFKVKIDNRKIYILDYDCLKLYRYPSLNQNVEYIYNHYLEVLNRLEPLIRETAHRNNIRLKG